MSAAEPAVALLGVRKAFPLAGGRALQVLDVERLELPPASTTVLRGRSGSGKTTLLNLIAGVSAPTSGAVLVHGTDVGALPQARRDRFRARHVGYVFQTFNLLPALSALENVMLAMMFAGTVPRRQQRGRARALLGRLGLDARLDHRPGALSRGEQQRVAIARALANDPPLVLADEPCASLDAASAAQVLETFVDHCRAGGRTLLMASHDAPPPGARVLDMGEVNRASASGAARGDEAT